MKRYIRKRASEPVTRRFYCNILHDKIPSYKLDGYVSYALRHFCVQWDLRRRFFYRAHRA